MASPPQARCFPTSLAMTVPSLPSINHLLSWHWYQGQPDAVLLSFEVEHVDGNSTPDMDDVRHTRRSRPADKKYQDLTYRECLTAALLIADHLSRRYAIGSQSTVAIISPNSPEMLLVMMALWLLESVVAPLAHDSHADNLKAMLQIVKADVVLGAGYDSSIADVVSEALGGGSLGSQIGADDEHVAALADRYLLDPTTQRQATAVLLFTSSGISAKSIKCVETPHSLWSEGCHAMLQREHPGASRPLRCVGWAPFSHMMGLGAAFFADVLCSHGTYIFVPEEDGAPLPARLLKCIQASSATHSAVSPIFLDYFQEHADDTGLQGYTLAVGGAAPRPSHWEWAQRVGVNLIQAPGSTECGPWGTSVAPPGVRTGADVPKDAVWPRSDLQVWLDGDGNEGELMIKGSNILSRYRDMNKTTLQDVGQEVRTFRTGDIFRRHAESGGLVYECRLDDLIPMASGEKVPALDREERLSAQLGIVRACIVGDEVPWEEGGFVLQPSNKLYAVIEVEERLSGQERREAAERAVRDTNGETEKQARVLLGDIIVLSAGEKLPLTRKGTLWRKKVWARFPQLLRDHLSSTKEPKLAAQLADIFARHLALDSSLLLSLSAPTFEEAGASSLVMQAVIKEVASETGHVLRLADLWSFATVSDLAQALCVRPETAAKASPKQEGDDVNAVGICGVSLRLPGGIDHTSDLWEALLGAPDGERVYDANIPERWGKTSMDRPEVNAAASRARWLPTSSFTDFDHALFGITAEAARHVNPCTRLGLMLTMEALENVGLKAEECHNLVPGQATGQCVGVWAAQSDSAGPRFREFELRGMDSYDRWYPLGASESAMAGRIAHSFGFHGPTSTVQAACASSLVALHQAATALAAGECDVAVVVSATTDVWPAELVYLQKSGLLAPNGQARVFSKDADGFVPSEGAIAFVLARSDRLPASMGKIVTSSVAHSGKGAAMAAPNGFAQEALLKSSLAKSGRSIDDVDVHEAHATGTQAGDAIELDALEQVFAGRATVKPLLTGSAKERLGHLEETAGALGLLKVILAMHHRRWPGMAAEENRLASPRNVKIAQTGVRLAKDRPLLGSVSSFGLTGTLAHLLVQGPTAPAKKDVREVTSEPTPLLITARDEASLRAACERWTRFAADPPVSLATAAAQTQSSRIHHSHRRAVIARDWQEATEQLKSPYKQRTRATTLRVLFSGRDDSFDECLADAHRWQDLAPTAELVAFDRALIALVAAQGSMSIHAGRHLWDLVSTAEEGELLVETREGPGASSKLAPDEDFIIGDGQTYVATKSGRRYTAPSLESLREWESEHGPATLKHAILSPWTGRVLPAGCPIGAGFWAKHLNGRACLPRLFDDVDGLVLDGHTGAALSLDGESVLSLFSSAPRPASLSNVGAMLFERGIDIKWPGTTPTPTRPHPLLSLPNTPILGPRLWTSA
ncbi:acetyl-CoA synthetase-like protein [Jaminaea rosea]|uniref:Acetyl-CoA synthetase-like protein n=1 Tax=Jaminaea rosea TaxID=1569628 RepID=A0A316UTE3_9BASI|nr:acetyl-CoA synthetase-like protein [Jaminaea rosea]PWN26365.1 acetyl-CoA synthetase-like protein [Jaminaea rosea]